MLEWHKLVEERNVWVAYNFPNHVSGVGSVLGCIEEVGELAHAHLKQDQNIRGDEAKHVADAKDAVGDLMVYLMGIMARSRPPRGFFSLETAENPEKALLMLASSVGRL